MGPCGASFETRNETTLWALIVDRALDRSRPDEAEIQWSRRIAIGRRQARVTPTAADPPTTGHGSY
jgi:hypothetical protein